MSTLDIILILCFVPALVHGFMKGFIAQVVAIISIIVGAWLSFRFSNEACAWLAPYLEVSDQVLHVIAFALIMVAAIVILYFVGKIVHGIVKIVMLGWLDRLLGVAFSLGTAILGIGLLIILFNTLNTNFNFVSEETLNASLLYNPIKDIAYTVFPYFKELLFKQ